MTYAELHDQVARLARSLRDAGVEKGDRVAGFMPNMPETVDRHACHGEHRRHLVFLLPDFGFKGVLDRFGQIEPKVLFTADGYCYNGKRFDSLERIRNVVAELPSVRHLVVVPYLDKKPVYCGYSQCGPLW